jgi:hypothetical protein
MRPVFHILKCLASFSFSFFLLWHLQGIMEKNDKKKKEFLPNALCQVKFLEEYITFTHKTLKENSQVCCCGVLHLELVVASPLTHSCGICVISLPFPCRVFFFFFFFLNFFWWV